MYLKQTLLRQPQPSWGIPAEFELPGNPVLIERKGTTLIIESDAKADLVDVLRSLSPLKPEDDFPTDLDAALKPLKPADL